MNSPRPFLAIPRVAQILGACVILWAAGCTTSESRNGKGELLPNFKYYAKCDTCNWCKGTFKRAQDAQKIVSEHNIAKHDYLRVAYYDTQKCK